MAAQNLTNDSTLAYLFRKQLLETYPVGSVYFTTGSANPGKLFGGTWAKVKDNFQLDTGKTCKVWERTK